MKELSIEQKARLYDEAIKRVENIRTGKCETTFMFTEGLFEHIFPELAESEDEKVRKALLEMIHDTTGDSLWIDYNVHKEDAISWLEKRGQTFTKKDIDDAYLKGICDAKKELEKQGEQKPVNKAKIGEKYVCVNCPRYTCFITGCVYEVKDSFMAALIGLCSNCFELHEVVDEQQVEPKFKVGDWIVRDLDNTCYKIKNCILNVTNNKYGYDLTSGGYISSQDAGFYHLWTIADAKDGDVLVCKGNIKNSNGIKYKRICLFNNLDNAFFTLTKLSNFVEEYGIDVNIDYPDNTVPATKEQKEILFMAMKDAGYTFDFEKKELKKIEQKSVEWNREDEQNLNACLGYIPDEFLRRWLTDAIHVKYDNPAWSEEDDNCLSTIIAEFSKCAGKSVSKDEWMRCNDWLNSLRDRVQPQPKQEWSEEDEKHLSWLIEHLNQSGELYSNLINWLKSLRPQSHWKPSKEQMEYLAKAITTLGDEGDCKTASILNCLRVELKKLRGE